MQCHYKKCYYEYSKGNNIRKGVLNMKLREFMKDFFISIKDGLSRFPTAFICTILFYLTLSFEIIFETNSEEVIIPLCMTFVLVAVFSVFLKTTQEYINEKLNPKLQYILCTIAAVTAFILIKLYYESLYTLMAYTGIIISLLCFIFFILMRGENKNLVFPKLVSSMVFTGAVCGVVSGGLSTCIAAFQSLIFTWNNIYKLYLIINLFVWVVGYINIFLSFIPKKDILTSQSKIFRTFVLFAGLPLYMLLIAILLIYLAKIVITWNMPVGEINWFASFASLFFIFFLLSVMQYTEKVAKLFVKLGGYFLFPVLIMQAIAVFERINAYGLTTPRTVSLVLIIISVLFIICSVAAPKHLNKVALISGIIALIVTVTPYNVIDMPIASQTNILKTVLTDNHMLTDVGVIPNPNVSDKDAQRIISAYEYLKYDAKKTPDFIPNSEKSLQEIFGFSKKYDYNRNGSTYIYCSYHTKESVDITNFDKLVKAYDDNDIIKAEHNGQKYEIYLKQIAKSLYEQYGTEQTELEIYKVSENISLYFTNFSFDMENDKITYCHFNGYLLIKN